MVLPSEVGGKSPNTLRLEHLREVANDAAKVVAKETAKEKARLAKAAKTQHAVDSGGGPPSRNTRKGGAHSPAPESEAVRARQEELKRLKAEKKDLDRRVKEGALEVKRLAAEAAAAGLAEKGPPVAPPHHEDQDPPESDEYASDSSSSSQRTQDSVVSDSEEERTRRAATKRGRGDTFSSGEKAPERDHRSSRRRSGSEGSTHRERSRRDPRPHHGTDHLGRHASPDPRTTRTGSPTRQDHPRRDASDRGAEPRRGAKGPQRRPTYYPPPREHHREPRDTPAYGSPPGSATEGRSVQWGDRPVGLTPDRRAPARDVSRDRGARAASVVVEPFEAWLRNIPLGTEAAVDLVGGWFRRQNYHLAFPEAILLLEEDELPADSFRAVTKIVWRAVQALRRAHPQHPGTSGSGHNLWPGPRGPPGPPGGSAGGQQGYSGTHSSDHSAYGGGWGGGSGRSNDPWAGGQSSHFSGEWGGRARQDASWDTNGQGGLNQGYGENRQWWSPGGPPGSEMDEYGPWARRTNHDQPGTTSQFRLRDADGTEFLCTHRTLGPERLRELQGMIRAMGASRFGNLVKDLAFDMAKFMEAADTYLYPEGHASMAADHPLGSLGGASSIRDTPVMKDRAHTEKALKLEFSRYDMTGLTLKSFLNPPETNPVWGQLATGSARRAMAAALSNMEIFLCAFFHPDYKGVMEPLTSMLTRGPKHGSLDLFEDIYVWLHIQRIISNWSQDVRLMSADLPSVCYPMARLGTPELVAYLLRVYILDMVQAAFPTRNYQPVGNHTEWVPMPHTSFYSEIGLHSRCQFSGPQAAKGKKPAVATAAEPGSGGKKQKPKEKQLTIEEPEEDDARNRDEKQQRKSMKQLLCPYHLRGLLGMTTHNGELRKCKFVGPRCSKRHVNSLKEVTKEEAMLATTDWAGEDQLARDNATDWKA